MSIEVHYQFINILLRHTFMWRHWTVRTVSVVSFQIPRAQCQIRDLSFLLESLSSVGMLREVVLSNLQVNKGGLVLGQCIKCDEKNN